MTALWYRIEAPHFVAGLRCTDGVVDHCAPILHWAIGKRLREVMRYCRKRGWRCAFLAVEEPPP